MAFPVEPVEVQDASEIYKKEFDGSLDQAAIYADFIFACIGKPCPAIVLTPICDIISKSPPYFTIAQIIPIEFVFEKLLFSRKLTEEQMIGKQPISPDELKYIKKHFIDYYLRNRTYRYHFLPELKGVIKNSFIDFQVVQTFNIAEIENYKKLTVLRSPWREAIPSRYAAYCLRIGTPEYTKDSLRTVFDNISNLKTK